jgi:hypothetical protein
MGLGATRSTNGILFDQGDKMKPKGKGIIPDKKPRNQAPNENERREARRRLLLRIAAIVLVIVFLAGECATLLPIE